MNHLLATPIEISLLYNDLVPTKKGTQQFEIFLTVRKGFIKHNYKRNYEAFDH
jgi:hypothetical protein